MKRLASFLLLSILFVMPGISQSMEVQPTKYDWSEISATVVGDAATPRDKAYAIYRWLCDNISYDTSYSIHDADNAIEQYRGVCQAYCEIFYHLASAADLEVDIISGKSKDHYCNIDDRGHAWIFAYIDGNKGILIDPTWGAGTVDNGVFTRSKNDDSWFDVSPEWIIFSHYPDDEAYQLMPRKVSMSEFAALPFLSPGMREFGFNGERILNDALSGKEIDMPVCYVSTLGDNKIGRVPLNGTLRVGERYEFALRPQGKYDFMIHNGDKYFSDWQSADGYIYCTFVPSEGGKPLTLSLTDQPYDENDQRKWSVIMKYNVAKASPEDIENLERLHPEKSPVLKNVENYYAEQFKAMNVDMAALLKEVKAKRIKTLPKIYDAVKFHIADIPWNGHLKAGVPVTFRISPLEGEKWVVISGGNWCADWSQSAPGQPWEMTVTPEAKGKLKVSASLPSDPESYWTCIEYEVD